MVGSPSTYTSIQTSSQAAGAGHTSADLGQTGLASSVPETQTAAVAAAVARRAYVIRLSPSGPSTGLVAKSAANGPTAIVPMRQAAKNGTSAEQTLPQILASKLPELSSPLLYIRPRRPWLVQPTSMSWFAYGAVALPAVVVRGASLGASPSCTVALATGAKAWRQTLQADKVPGRKQMGPGAVDTLRLPGDKSSGLLVTTFLAVLFAKATH